MFVEPSPTVTSVSTTGLTSTSESTLGTNQSDSDPMSNNTYDPMSNNTYSSFNGTIECTGNIDQAWNCFECYNSSILEYLWGSKCEAKRMFSTTVMEGRCGLDYACITTDIGDCPYNEYCPQSSQGKKQ